MNRTPWGSPIPTQDGHYVQLYEDGSATTYDQYWNVVNDDPSPNPMRAALASAGRANDAAIDAVKNSASAEDARRFGLTNQNSVRALDQRATEIGNTYKVNMLNARTSADAQRATAQYQQDQSQLQRDRLQFDRETQAQNFGLSQATLGYNLVNTAAGLSGPADYFKADEYARGVSGNPNTSTFLSALQDNTRMAGFGAQGGVPEPETLGSLTAKLAGGGNPSTGNYLAQIGNVAAKGAHQLGAGALEQLTPTERSLFTAGLGKLGYDPDTFLSQYANSRIGQGTGFGRAA